MRVKKMPIKITKIIQEELKKFISEQSLNPTSYSLSDTVLYLFDFDDTLAHTDNVVKVTHVDAKTGEVGKTHSMDSESFEKYRQSPPGDRARDIVNFEDFETVLNPVEIKSILDLVKKAQSDPSNIVAIITSRAGKKNSNDITDFLESKGVKNIPVHTVGDTGGKPSDKLEVVRKYVEDYAPKEIFFYDDSKRNLSAVLSLCTGEYPGLQVNTFDVINGKPVPDSDCQSTEDILL